MHLNRNGDAIDGCVHLAGGLAGSSVEVEIPEPYARSSAVKDESGRTPIHFSVQHLEPRRPELNKLYTVGLRAGNDSIEDLIGFRTIEAHGTKILPKWIPHLPKEALIKWQTIPQGLKPD